MMGRPSSYSPEIAEKICVELMAGKSLREICRGEEFPEASTIFLWIHKHPEFSEQYARAREIQAETLADELCEIADDGTNDWEERQNRDGSTYIALNSEHIQRSKLRVDTRKWIASKLLPKKYGDKVETTLTGPNGGPVEAKVVVEFVGS